jgi:hypothetical protein
MNENDSEKADAAHIQALVRWVWEPDVLNWTTVALGGAPLTFTFAEADRLRALNVHNAWFDPTQIGHRACLYFDFTASCVDLLKLFRKLHANIISKSPNQILLDKHLLSTKGVRWSDGKDLSLPADLPALQTLNPPGSVHLCETEMELLKCEPIAVIRCLEYGLTRCVALHAKFQTLTSSSSFAIPRGHWSNAFVPGLPVSHSVEKAFQTPLTYAQQIQPNTTQEPKFHDGFGGPIAVYLNRVTEFGKPALNLNKTPFVAGATTKITPSTDLTSVDELKSGTEEKASPKITRRKALTPSDAKLDGGPHEDDNSSNTKETALPKITRRAALTPSDAKLILPKITRLSDALKTELGWGSDEYDDSSDTEERALPKITRRKALTPSDAKLISDAFETKLGWGEAVTDSTNSTNKASDALSTTATLKNPKHMSPSPILDYPMIEDNNERRDAILDAAIFAVAADRRQTIADDTKTKIELIALQNLPETKSAQGAQSNQPQAQEAQSNPPGADISLVAKTKNVNDGTSVAQPATEIKSTDISLVAQPAETQNVNDGTSVAQPATEIKSIQQAQGNPQNPSADISLVARPAETQNVNDGTAAEEKIKSAQKAQGNQGKNAKAKHKQSTNTVNPNLETEKEKTQRTAVIAQFKSTFESQANALQTHDSSNDNLSQLLELHKKSTDLDLLIAEEIKEAEQKYPKKAKFPDVLGELNRVKLQVRRNVNALVSLIDSQMRQEIDRVFSSSVPTQQQVQTLNLFANNQALQNTSSMRHLAEKDDQHGSSKSLSVKDKVKRALEDLTMRAYDPANYIKQITAVDQQLQLANRLYDELRYIPPSRLRLPMFSEKRGQIEQILKNISTEDRRRMKQDEAIIDLQQKVNQLDQRSQDDVRKDILRAMGNWESVAEELDSRINVLISPEAPFIEEAKQVIQQINQLQASKHSKANKDAIARLKNQLDDYEKKQKIWHDEHKNQQLIGELAIRRQTVEKSLAEAQLGLLHLSDDITSTEKALRKLLTDSPKHKTVDAFNEYADYALAAAKLICENVELNDVNGSIEINAMLKLLTENDHEHKYTEQIKTLASLARARALDEQQLQRVLNAIQQKSVTRQIMQEIENMESKPYNGTTYDLLSKALKEAKSEHKTSFFNATARGALNRVGRISRGVLKLGAGAISGAFGLAVASGALPHLVQAGMQAMAGPAALQKIENAGFERGFRYYTDDGVRYSTRVFSAPLLQMQHPLSIERVTRGQLLIALASLPPTNVLHWCRNLSWAFIQSGIAGKCRQRYTALCALWSERRKSL